MRPWLALVVALLVAGCAEDPVDGGTDGPDGDEGRATVDAPVWEVGDWWTYEFGDGARRTWVVTDASDGYFLDTDAEDFAFFHAAFNPISTVGEISLDLDGSQNGPVQFFDWPLQDGKSWTMTWDGFDFTVNATATDDGFRMDASEPGGRQRTYTYDTEREWLGQTTALLPDGSTEWEAGLRGSGHNYTDEYVRWQIHADERFNLTGFGQAQVQEFDVPDTATDLWYTLDVFCNPDGLEGDQGALAYRIGPSEGDPVLSDETTCPTELHDGGTLDAVPGTWQVDGASAGGTVDFHVIVRELQTFTL